MKTGIQLIAEERQKQINKHGFTGEHHAKHPEWYDKGQLVYAAIRLIDYEVDGITAIYKNLVPENWDLEWWQRLCDKPKEERLIIASALIAAELDRIAITKNVWIEESSEIDKEAYSKLSKRNIIDPNKLQ